MNPQLKSLFMLDPKITYLNHGSFGACPRPIFEELINWQKQLEYEPVKHLAYDIYDHLEESRDALSKYVNCNKDDIIFTPNPSTALNTVIKSLDLKKDDEILTVLLNLCFAAQKSNLLQILLSYLLFRQHLSDPQMKRSSNYQ